MKDWRQTQYPTHSMPDAPTGQGDLKWPILVVGIVVCLIASAVVFVVSWL